MEKGLLQGGGEDLDFAAVPFGFFAQPAFDPHRAQRGQAQFQLLHHHGGQVLQGGQVGGADLSGARVEDVHGSQAESVGGGDRGGRVELDSHRTVTRGLAAVRGSRSASVIT